MNYNYFISIVGFTNFTTFAMLITTFMKYKCGELRKGRWALGAGDIAQKYYKLGRIITRAGVKFIARRRLQMSLSQYGLMW